MWPTSRPLSFGSCGTTRPSTPSTEVEAIDSERCGWWNCSAGRRGSGVVRYCRLPWRMRCWMSPRAEPTPTVGVEIFAGKSAFGGMTAQEIGRQFAALRGAVQRCGYVF